MISRQIGATLSAFSGPGFSALRPSMTCASRSGRNATEPFALLHLADGLRQLGAAVQRGEQLAVEGVDLHAQREQVGIRGVVLSHGAKRIPGGKTRAARTPSTGIAL